MSGGRYLVNSRTQERIAINGCRSSSRQLDCQPFCNYVKYTEDQLPRVADLRPYMPDIEDQRETLTCVANALAGAYEYLLRRGANDTTEMSRLFIYYNGRAIDPVLGQNLEKDDGCDIKYAVPSLQQYGTCNENNWPFREDAIPVKPDDQVYQEAQNYTILEYNDLKLDILKMKSCLAQGFPFIFGMRLFDSFGEAKTNGGKVRYPDANDKAASKHRLHAMLAVGYIDEMKVFIVRNSWGETWGDNGYLYIPYDYMTDPNMTRDLFVIKQFSKIELGTDHWKESASELNFPEPSAFGASADGSNDADAWGFEGDDEDDNGQGAPGGNQGFGGNQSDDQEEDE